MPPNIASSGFAYPNSRVTAQTLDWPVIGTDPQDDWWREASSIGNRSWHLWRNNPYAVAMVNTMLEGTLGSKGLIARSVYNCDAGLELGTSDPATMAALGKIRDQRQAIEQSLRAAYRGKRFDAVGQLTKREMSVVMMISCMVAGDAFAVRLWKPNRPGRQVQATCWRIIDPARVSNPNFGFNTATLFEGIALNDDGVPIGIWIQRRNPYALQVVSWVWDYIPFWAPDGTQNVVHMKAPGRPDQLRGVGWFAAIMGLVNQMGSVTDAYVVAKRVQACIGLVRSTGNPTATVASQQAGTQTTTTGAARLYPGIIMDLPLGSTVAPLNWGFQGEDHSSFQDSMLQAICAAWSLPMEYVQHRLTKTNMAASRAALMQAYRTFATAQEMLIAHCEQPWAESVVAEDIARGRIQLDSADMDLITAFRFNRPQRAQPDPIKDAAAGQVMAGLGKSLSAIHAEQGLDYEEEVLQMHTDIAFAKFHGVPIVGVGGMPAPAPGDGTNPDGTSVTDDGAVAPAEAAGQEAAA